MRLQTKWVIPNVHAAVLSAGGSTTAVPCAFGGAWSKPAVSLVRFPVRPGVPPAHPCVRCGEPAQGTGVIARRFSHMNPCPRHASANIIYIMRLRGNTVFGRNIAPFKVSLLYEKKGGGNAVWKKKTKKRFGELFTSCQYLLLRSTSYCYFIALTKRSNIWLQ